jgi:hypothetical protein
MDYLHFFYSVKNLTNIKVDEESHKMATVFIESSIRTPNDETIEDKISLVLEKYAPNITYLHFRKLIKLASTYQQSYRDDYYDEEPKTEIIQKIKVKDLYDTLLSLGYLKMDCEAFSTEENSVNIFLNNMKKIKIDGIYFSKKDNVFQIERNNITQFPDEFYDLFSLNKLHIHTRKNLVSHLINQIENICYCDDVSMDICAFYVLIDNVFNITKRKK